ncbi:MAG: hypothetical protein P8N31_13430 [Planctomycetota bacterium]|jgi:hypothetical protein|nr:hypothetical protein [Planctomycetota bacterium]MDG2144547.1 hypothetical protein [Planctomycetota bacterium]
MTKASAPTSEYRMAKWPLIAILLALVFMLIPSKSDTFAVDEVTLVDSEISELGMRLDFRVPDGESSPGIWVESEGNEHFVSFARTIDGKSPAVDIPCTSAASSSGPTGFSVLIPTIRPFLEPGTSLRVIQVGPSQEKVLLELDSTQIGDSRL